MGGLVVYCGARPLSNQAGKTNHTLQAVIRYAVDSLNQLADDGIPISSTGTYDPEGRDPKDTRATFVVLVLKSSFWGC